MTNHEELMARARAGAVEREYAHREKVREIVAAVEAEIRRWGDERPVIGVLPEDPERWTRPVVGSAFTVGGYGGTYCTMTVRVTELRGWERWRWRLRHPMRAVKAATRGWRR